MSKKKAINEFMQSRKQKLHENFTDEIAEKARKFDELEKIVASFYIDDDGNEVEESEGGLLDIGEKVAMYFGYL